jgi:hypothetical protein
VIFAVQQIGELFLVGEQHLYDALMSSCSRNV